MFGFFHPHNREGNPVALPAAAAALPPGTLVSKEDIYRENKGMSPILLLRKGYEVSMEELPRFIRNGARPHQFLFKPAEGHDVASIDAPSPLPHQLKALRRHGLMDEFDAAPYQPLQRDPREKKRVLILEPSQKGLKRLIDCLFICGTSLDRIHTVRMPEQLAWAMAKYQPQILIVDYALPNEQNGLELLAGFKSLQGIEKIIFTVAPDAPMSNEEIQTLETFCPEKKIKILKKPVSRFTVNRILAE